MEHSDMDCAHTRTDTLDCPKGFDYAFMLAFIAPRMIKGVEVVADNIYSRSFRFFDPKDSATVYLGYFKVAYLPHTNQLTLTTVSNQASAAAYVLQRVIFMFDLQTDLSQVEEVLKADLILQRGFENGRVPRMPKAFDPFEFCIRAVLGQQVSVKAATTLASRVAYAANLPVPHDFPDGIDCFFPQFEDLLEASFEGLGLTQSRMATLRTVIQALEVKEVSLEKDQIFEDYLTEWTSLTGVGPWTANYLAMRGLGIQDSFPDKDLGVLKALAVDGVYPSRKVVLEQAKAWQPYRAYATLCLWNGLGH
ncbi:DNA-3-methyladenine glycosylase 2 [Vibrio rumoiensis]|nr:AlkA N-terminal domain-containing protein [Vibrio rumoiensis]